jgi:hypothetical protein
MKTKFLVKIGVSIAALCCLAAGTNAQSVKIYPSTIRVEKGKTKTITAVAYNGNTPAFNAEFSFNLQFPAVATSGLARVSDGDINTQTLSPPNLRTITGVAAGTTLITATWLGHTSSAQATIIVDDTSASPTAIIHGDNDAGGGTTITARVGEAIEVNADESKGVAKSEWSWGDGDKTTDLLSATHAYLALGNYALKLTTTNDSGQAAVSTVTVTVTAQTACTAANTDFVTSVATLQSKYETIPIAGGRCILLSPNIYTGELTLIARPFADYVTIGSSAAMPDIYTRVGSGQSGLVTIVPSSPADVKSALTIKNGASKLRFIGIKFDAAYSSAAGDDNSNDYIVQIGEAFNPPTSVSQNPSKIIFEHCVINPHEDVRVPHAIINDGYKVSMIASWFGNIKTLGALRDCQAVYSLNGRGAHVYNNTFLEASAENIMYGGAVLTIDGLVSTNIEFRRCYFTKRSSWRVYNCIEGECVHPINEKNLFEIKNARRVYVEGSVFENHWDAGIGQRYALAVKSATAPAGPDDFVPWAIGEDVIFENDKIRHIYGGMTTAADNYFIQPFHGLKVHNVRIKNSLFDDLSERWGVPEGVDLDARFLQPIDVEDLQLNHVTMIDKDQTAGTAVLFITNNNFRFSMTNSIFGLRGTGISGTAVTSGIPSLNFATGGTNDNCTRDGSWIVARNVMPIYGASSGCYPKPFVVPPQTPPAGANYYPANYNSIGFVDLANGNFRLGASSPYKNQGTDSQDPGADIPLLDQRTSCTVTGATAPCLTSTTQSPYPGPAATVIPAVLEAENFDRGGEGLAFHDTDTANTGGAYRADGVDIQGRSTASNGFEIFDAHAGEWMEYTVNVPYTRKFDIGVRYASAVSGGQFRIDDCGSDPNNNTCSDITGLFAADSTSTDGTWNKFRVATKRGIQLSAGNHTLRLVMVTNTSQACQCVVADFDSILFKSALFDFDNDGKSDISVYRPTDGNWYLNRSKDGFTAINFGLSTDIMAPADFDGDGKTDIAVFRPSSGTWYILRSSDSQVTGVQFGANGDMPVQADYDNDGKADIAVWRPSDGTWYRLNSSTGAFVTVQFGQNLDLPAVGDYDGDGKYDQAVFRPSTASWYLLRSATGLSTVNFGLSGDKIAPADYDGDGKTDIAVFRPSNGTWYRIDSGSGQVVSAQFGQSGDIPVSADYDGDGKVDIGVFRPSNGGWYIIESLSQATTAQIFGLSGDVPVPSTYVR